MTLDEQRENGRRCYDLAIAMLRWEHLRAAYSLARERRHGQRKAWVALRQHVAEMMRDGL